MTYLSALGSVQFSSVIFRVA